MDRPEASENFGPPGLDTNRAFDASASTSLDATAVVSSTSVDANVVARFEFDSIGGNAGTRVLLVEWNCRPGADEPPAHKCDVTWEGKSAALTTFDNAASSATTRRLICLLPPTAAVPPIVSIRRPGRSTLQARPLPAIFAPGLGGPDAPDAGRRGVLHTLFATTRMSVLEAETAREARENPESVGLDMILKEKEWLVDYFGIKDKEADVAKPVLTPLTTGAPTSPKPSANPQSPMSTRMAEKLRGLKLATTPESLAAAASEVKAANPGGVPGMVPMATLTPANSAGNVGYDDDDGEELFALPMSPRSPEMKRSPFSILS